MAVYVYNTASGELYSWVPDDADPVASDDELAAAGLTAITGLPAIDDTHAWDPATKTVITVTPASRPAPILTAVWILRFAPAEFQAINTSTDAVVQQFMYALNHTTEVDLSTDAIVNGVHYLVSINLLQAARVVAILAIPASRRGP